MAILQVNFLSQTLKWIAPIQKDTDVIEVLKFLF
jgi:hypothetical protein